jgi:hypothetical protein
VVNVFNGQQRELELREAAIRLRLAFLRVLDDRYDVSTRSMFGVPRTKVSRRQSTLPNVRLLPESDRALRALISLFYH